MSDDLSALHDAVIDATSARLAYRRREIRQHIEAIGDRNREYIAQRRRELGEQLAQDVPATDRDGSHGGAGGSDAVEADGREAGDQGG